MANPLEAAQNLNRLMKKQFVTYDNGPFNMGEEFNDQARKEDAKNSISQQSKINLQDSAFREAIKNTDGLPDNKKQDFVKYIHEELVRQGYE